MASIASTISAAMADLTDEECDRSGDKFTCHAARAPPRHAAASRCRVTLPRHAAASPRRARRRSLAAARAGAGRDVSN
jgi:hypothetical protein